MVLKESLKTGAKGKTRIYIIGALIETRIAQHIGRKDESAGQSHWMKETFTIVERCVKQTRMRGMPSVIAAR